MTEFGSDGWYQIQVSIPLSLSDVVSDLLFELGSCGFQTEDVEASPQVRFTAYFHHSHPPERILSDLSGNLARIGLTEPFRPIVAGVPTVDWTRAWRKHFKTIHPSPRITVSPSWDPAEAPPGGATILIEPEMGFGTGHHESTRLAIQAIDAYLVPGDRLLDVGTGSGILSIAGVKLGAHSAVAVDLNRQALSNARRNLALNAANQGVRLIQGSVDAIRGTFDLVAANIISSILKPLLPEMRDLLSHSGRIILGGVLEAERGAFLTGVHEAGILPIEVRTEGEWVCVVGEHSRKPAQ